MKNVAQTAPFSRVPVELLEEIIQLCPRAVLPSLCQVSRQFNLPTIRLLYREINLVTSLTVLRCCRSLASNPSAASAVKAFKIDYFTPPGPLLRSFYQTLSDAFHNLSQLLDLELLFHDPNFLLILTTCTFPRLRRFECYLPYSSTIASFLARHPDINYLQLSPADRISTGDTTDRLPRVVLPKLEYLIGSNDLVSALAHGASLRAAYIEWTRVDHAVHECIAALEHSSSDTLRVLSCRRAGWNLDLVDAVSTALPDILVLSITNVLLVDVLPNYDTLEAMGTYLSRFTSLRRLIVHSVDFWDFGQPPCLMDRDFACVRTWGGACPSLAECTLPHGLKWTRVRENIWFPDPLHRKGSEWLTHMICSRRFPEIEQLIDAIEQLVHERVGIDGGGSDHPTATELHQAIMRLRTLGKRRSRRRSQSPDRDRDQDEGEEENNNDAGNDRVEDASGDGVDGDV